MPSRREARITKKQRPKPQSNGNQSYNDEHENISALTLKMLP